MNFFEDIEEKVQKYIDSHISNHIDRFINPRLLGTILITITFILVCISCIEKAIFNHNIIEGILFPLMVVGGSKFSYDSYKVYKDSECYNYNTSTTVSVEYTWISNFKKYAYMLTLLDIVILIYTFIFKNIIDTNLDSVIEDVVFIVGLHLVCTFPKHPIFYYRGKLSNV